MSQILASIKGRLLGLNQEQRLQSVKGIEIGNHGKQRRIEGPDTVGFFEDFVGISTQALNPKLVYTEGTDTTTAGMVVVAGVDGFLRVTPGDSAGSIAADGAMINSELNWKANQGGLYMQVRIAIAAITTVSLFVGFTDTLALEGPVSLSGTTFTTNASDAVGFLFDTAATADTIRLVGVAADTDATMQDTGLAFVAATYKTLRVELSTTGAATFFIDGVSVGTVMTGAVTATVALTPVLIIRPEGAVAGRTFDLDYIDVAANRAS